ncbi:MAG: hypothetical protein Q6353_009220 [Candidatus Sigynarchaeum springense]
MAATTTTLSIPSSKPKRPREPTYIAVRWAFWVEVLVYFGLVALFASWNYRNIDWNGYGFISLLPELVPSALVAGLVGGLMTRHVSKGALPGFAMATFTGPCLLLVSLIDSLCRSFGFDPMIYPEVTSNQVVDGILWYLPVFVAIACAAPMGILGGYLGRRFLKIPPGARLTPGEQMEKFLDAFKKPLFLLIFLIAWTPLIIPLFSIDDSVHKEYSAWNYGDAGTSEFRKAIESAGYDTMSSIGSYSLLSRIDEPFVLVIMGPNKFYNLVSDIPFLLKFVRSGGSLLIAHEQGTTEMLFLNMFLASAIAGAPKPFPLTFFMDGILRDNVSYYNTNDFPVIDTPNIAPHAVTAGVSRLVLNRASGLMLEGGLEAIFNWNDVASSTNAYSWVDKNDDGRYARDVDYFDPYELGVPMILFEPLKLLGFSFPAGLPQGGMAIPVVGVTDLGTSNSSRVVVTADASMFSNQLIDLPGFDNRQFAINCINWLSRGNTSMKVVFDEAHLRPVAMQDTSPAAVYGTMLDFIGFLSSNWLLAPFYPFIALRLLRRWLPNEEKKRKLQEKKRKREQRKAKRLEEREKRQRQRLGKYIFERAAAKTQKQKAGEKAPGEKAPKTLAERHAERKMQGILKKSTFFAQKLAWYLEQPDFNKALELLFNRVKRLAGKKLGEQADERTIISAIMEKNPQVEQRRLESFFRLMRRVTAKKGSGRVRITRAENLEKLYYEIITVAEYLEKL